MRQCFAEFYRVLKPGRWMTVEFHNSQNRVWTAIQEGIQHAGFVVCDVRTLDKQQGSFKQYTSANAVKQDLVISAYKPSADFEEKFKVAPGTEAGHGSLYARIYGIFLFSLSRLVGRKLSQSVMDICFLTEWWCSMFSEATQFHCPHPSSTRVCYRSSPKGMECTFSQIKCLNTTSSEPRSRRLSSFNCSLMTRRLRFSGFAAK